MNVRLMTDNPEFLSADRIRSLQEDLLRRHIAYIADRSPFYRRRFLDAGIDPCGIATLEDLQRLPFTDKGDLEQYGYDLLCCPEEEIVDLCLTSGTTGEPVAMMQTASDLVRVGYNEEVTFRAAGIGPEDRVVIAAAIDRCFMAGLAYFMGLTRIGATAIRGGSSSLLALEQLVHRFAPTTIVGVPTLMLALADRMAAGGTDPAFCGVERLICIGEPVRDPDLSLSALGRRIGQAWGAQVFGTYASTEMATTFGDCSAGRGGHIHPELIIVEIVDEEGRPLPPGEPGEVVATPLQVTGMPLLRFRTGDIATLVDEPCACGRNSARLGPVLGRKNQMLKVRGTTVYPPAIARVLQEIEAVRCYYIEVFNEFELSDRLRVVIGSDDPSLTPQAVGERLRAVIRVRPEVEVAPVEEVRRRTLCEEKRKPVTFFDHRES